jgi:hypothetical protein
MVTLVTKVVIYVSLVDISCLFCPILIKLGYSKQIYYPICPPSIKYYENPYDGSRVVSRGWTDGQT